VIHPAPHWLAAWQSRALTTDQALVRFDGLEPLSTARMHGAWQGSGLHSGHPLDGLLEAYAWHGKTFRSDDDVDPLVFPAGDNAFMALQPALLPIGLALGWPRLARSVLARGVFGVIRPLLRARGPAARLRMVRHRNVGSAAMIYDRIPVIDHFRCIDEHRVLGLMDLRQTSQPFFFLLTREKLR
jgi:hypothetical protein